MSNVNYYNNINELMDTLQKAQNFRLEKQNYKVGRDRNSYFDSHDDIYDRISDNIDELNFYVDVTTELRDEFSYNPSTTISEFFEVISNNDIEDLSGYDVLSEEQQEIIEDMTLEDLKERNELMYNSMVSILDNLTDEDIDIYNDGSTLFDCDYVDEKINDCTYDRLAYWTVYFEPSYFDEEIAQKVGLVPFEFEGTKLLALGGCGMDLSPKLDAYIALTYDHIPEDSSFFRESDYFKYVVGSKVAQEIEDKCKLEYPHYVLEFNATEKENVEENTL